MSQYISSVEILTEKKKKTFNLKITAIHHQLINVRKHAPIFSQKQGNGLKMVVRALAHLTQCLAVAINYLFSLGSYQ